MTDIVSPDGPRSSDVGIRPFTGLLPSVVSRPPDQTVFRAAAGMFAGGVCVVSTVHLGVDHAMTVSAFTAVSLDPPLVLVCVAREARFHEAVIGSGTWAVSVLDTTAEGVADWLSSRGRPLVGQLDRVPYRRGELTGAALPHQAVAWFECRTHAVHPAGDHSILVGEVVGVETGSGEIGVLLRHRGAYRHVR